MAGYGKIDDEEVAAVGSIAVAKVKSFMASSHLSNMKDWVGDGPITLRAAALFGGAMLVLTGFFGTLGSLFSPLKLIMEAYMFCFGVLIVMLEAKNNLCKDNWMNILKKEAKFLTLLAGRGYFYIVLGTLLMAQWPDVGNFLLGLYMTCVGGLMTVVGLHAKAKMDKMKGHIKDEAAVVAAFKKADVDQTGSLSIEQLASLCKELGSDLDRLELEAAVGSLDKDGSGSVEYEEFFDWWSSTV
uniref:EF-hand domain-containing protein n=1 Tax=Florenciella parvula TaxID=236787 RepID=A0A7S2BIR7_9STRA|eukprot:CAMPEP_0182533144 /NCGR_PEP_ID=MMETSP1323-20130603/13174_1 /TAXON_ID=236787 /ORGANISM="Florenciella parvula, Strain RCC1693" /LENGTH=241 /DNA_ID=CAMNT_0024742993 /DNA_START=32 /DNA_END=757 /DNA_ORIENTATION=+